MSGKKKEVWEHINTHQGEAKKLLVEIEAHRSKMEAIRETQTDVKEQADVVQESINKKNEELKKLFDSKFE